MQLLSSPSQFGLHVQGGDALARGPWRCRVVIKWRGKRWRVEDVWLQDADLRRLETWLWHLADGRTDIPRLSLTPELALEVANNGVRVELFGRCRPPWLAAGLAGFTIPQTPEHIRATAVQWSRSTGRCTGT